VLPARVPGYQSRWLDEWSAGGAGSCVGQGSEGLDLLAFFGRETIRQMAAPASAETALTEAEAAVLDRLRSHGASFLADLALDTGLSPAAVRSGLWGLLRRCLVTNDRVDVIRRGEQADFPEAEAPSAARGRVMAKPTLRRPGHTPNRRSGAHVRQLRKPSLASQVGLHAGVLGRSPSPPPELSMLGCYASWFSCA